MGELSDFAVGQTVELQDGRIAIVRFVGSLHFAQGDWIGVELNDTSGKNDGSVQGQRYFNCGAGHGMFVRPGVAAVIDQPTPRLIKKKDGTLTAANTGPRQSMAQGGALRRRSVIDPVTKRRQSINGGSPTLSVRSATPRQTLRSPSKSPTKQILSGPSSGHITPRDSLPSSTPKQSVPASRPAVKASARPSTGVTSTATSRPARHHLVEPLNGAAKPSLSTQRPALQLPTIQQDQVGSRSHNGDGNIAEADGLESSRDSPDHKPPSPPMDETHDPYPLTTLSLALSRTSVMSPTMALSADADLLSGQLERTDRRHATGPALASATIPSKEVADLTTRLKMMEKKRVEDIEKLKTLYKVQIERDKFEGIILKLQAKYQPQQKEIAELKRQIKEAEAKAEANENQQFDLDTAMEMATLDREMAEENADSLRMEVEALRQKHEELELEVELLREENMELGKEMSPEERTSQGWMQMERSNERLREALIRLRDVAQEQEGELKQQIKELEVDVREHAKLQKQHKDTQESLMHTNTTVENLRQQLEIALGAEDMIEDLTDKNMTLSEQIDELKAAVEDLESLKDLNDELEMNHVDAEKQMQDEIDFKEMIIKENIRKSNLQDETIGDLEYTVSRFRELVTNLHSDLEDMRASQQITETEANDLNNRSKAMLDLNMRLQVSATKAQVKAIDLELRMLDARESAEHLAIIQLFLPDGFVKAQESINTLLRFRRIRFKSFLIHGFVKERLSSHKYAGHEDDMLACCDLLGKLIWISTMCDRFIQFMHVSSLEEFDRLGSALYDLEPVERGLNGWIDGLKKDELREQHCAAELQRSIALLTHLAEIHITDGLQQCAEHIRMAAFMIQSSLESAALALSITKSMAQSQAPAHSKDDEGGDEAFQHLLRKIDTLIAQVRSAKVVSSKAIHQLQELQSRSLILEPSTLESIQQFQSPITELVSICRQSSLSLFTAINEESRTSLLTSHDVAKAISLDNSIPLDTMYSLVHAATTQMRSLYQLTANLTRCVEAPLPPLTPWELLSRKLRAVSDASAMHEISANRLKHELSDKNTALAMKDKILEEMIANVEVLEKRASESSKRQERLRDLEGAADSALMKDKETAKEMLHLEQELQILQKEREAWEEHFHQAGAQAGPGDVKISSHDADQYEIVATRAHENVLQLKAEIELLQSTIRHLRMLGHVRSITSTHSFLATPLTSKKTVSNEMHLAYEAQDMFKSMLTLISQPKNQVVKMAAIDRPQRLGWRPVRQTMRWQVGRQREKWEGWREWRDNVASRGREMESERRRKAMVDTEKGNMLARVGLHLPGLVDKAAAGTKDVRILIPGD